MTACRTQPFVAILLAVGLFVASERSVWAQRPPALVSATPVVEQQDVVAGRTFVGTVHPARRSVIGSAVDGRVVKFPVEEGDAVKQGQPLCQLLTESLEIQIAGAQAELNLRRSEYAEMQAGSREQEIREAGARMISAQAAADYSEAKLQRTRQLLERNAASQDELQDHTSAASVTRQLYEAARANYDLVKAGPRQERVDQALARVHIAEETVNQLLDRLKKHTMISPFDGYVTKQHTEIGQWISTGQLVAEVVETKQVDVIIEVPETYIPNLEIGSSARVEIGALPQHVFEGKVTQIVPQADVRSRNFPVKVRLDNQAMPDGQMMIKPGMFARAALAVETKSRVLLVPKDALVMGGPVPMVYVIDGVAAGGKQGKVRPVQVALGVASGGAVEVEGAIQADQLVVVEGNERLMPGQDVTITRTIPPVGVKLPTPPTPPTASAASTGQGG